MIFLGSDRKIPLCIDTTAEKGAVVNTTFLSIILKSVKICKILCFRSIYVKLHVSSRSVNSNCSIFSTDITVIFQNYHYTSIYHCLIPQFLHNLITHVLHHNTLFLKNLKYAKKFNIPRFLPNLSLYKEAFKICDQGGEWKN